MSKRFYISTAIDYVNGHPHLGHAYEKVVADVIARSRRSMGRETFFLTGLDEHGQKVQQAALAEGKTPQAYCDELAQFNIQVNAIAPGYFATKLTAETRANAAINQRILDHIPANRWGDLMDLMGTTVFLASRAGAYTTGSVIPVDGGISTL